MPASTNADFMTMEEFAQEEAAGRVVPAEGTSATYASATGSQGPGGSPFPFERTNLYFDGSMPPQFQLDSSFSRGRVHSGRVPTGSLMPFGPNANPSTNAAIQSTATKTFLSLPSSASGNATQFQGIPIKASPSNQDVYQFNGTDWELVLLDGLVHGTTPWWNDPSFFYFVDDFVNWEGSGPFTDTINAAKGQVSRGWTFFGNNAITGNDAPRLIGGAPPFLGQFTHGNSATTAQYSGLAFNYVDGSVGHPEQCWALLENPGWVATWIFKIAGEPLINASVGSDSLTAQNKKAIYIGLAGANTNSMFNSSTNFGPRPNMFIGLRYDTSRMPPSLQITSVANASAGSTVYTGTFGNALYSGQNVTVTGCTNAANNGTFACTANTTTTLTLSNAGGVAETTVAQNAVANPASLPLTSVNATSGGTTVYNFTAITGLAANQLVGLSLVIAGFTNSVNNGTFLCVANGTTTLTLVNNAGVAETHAGTATGGTIGDAFWTIEAVLNRQYSSPANVLTQGQTFVTSVPITASGFHRVDIICTVAGQVKVVLDGSATNQATFTIPTIKIDTSGGNSTVRATGQTAQVNFVVSAASLAGTNGSYPPFGAGSSITWAGFSAPYANLNGTFILDNQIDVSGSPSLYFPVANNGGQNTIGGYSATGFPAFTPIITWGNDNAPAPQTCFRIYVDYFGICWGKGLSTAGASGAAPNPSLARY